MTRAEEHVTGHLADYVADRLDPATREAMEVHLRACDDCRADLQIARGLRSLGTARDEAHLAPESIAALAGAPASIGTSERAHLDACGSCRAELALATSAVDEATWTAATAGTAPRRARRPRSTAGRLLRWAPLGAAAAVAFALWIGADDVGDLARIEELPVPVTRALDPSDDADLRRVEAFELYRSRDYAAAAERLAEIAETAELRLYLGSARLLAGDTDGAIDVLEPLAADTDAGALRSEALWQLANAYLAADRPEPATGALRTIVATPGRRTAEAERLLERLAAAD